MISKGANVDYAGEDGGKLLYTAAEEGHLDMVKFLLDKGAYIDAKGENVVIMFGVLKTREDTSLHAATVAAIEKGRLDVVRLLLDRGADVNAKDSLKGHIPLHLAVYSGNLDLVKLFIEKGADINAKGNDGKTPLHWAAYNGYLDVVKCLVEKGADINAKSNGGWTPLHLAAYDGKLDVVKCLVEKGADINAKNNDGETPLHLAARYGYLDVVKCLVEKGADINVKDNDGEAPLYRAAYNGKLDVIKYLTERVQQATEVPHTTERQQVTTEISQTTEEQQVTTEVPQVTEDYSYMSLHDAARQGNLNAVKYFVERGVNINAKGDGGWTPLHWAAYNDYLDVVRYLVEKGADINVKDNGGETPLHWAAYNDYLDVVRYLVEKGADINVKDNGGETPLHSAARYGKLDVVKYLVEKGADINAKNNDGKTPLHLAAYNGKLDVVKCLVEKGADINAKDNDGKTPLHWAAEYGKLDVVKCLVEKGADINAKNNDGETPLRLAAYDGKLDVVKYLVEKGADINAKSNGGWTPLHGSNGKLDVVKYLVEKGADINAKDNGGETPLYSAARYGDLDVVKYLKSKGARRYRRSIESDNLAIENTQAVSRINKLSSWTNNSIINWAKGLVSSTESPDLLTSRGHDNTTVTAVPEINTTVVNNTLMLGILATSLFNKTQHKQPIHENLLSPREQSMRLNNIDDKGEATSGTSKPSSWINDLCGWVKEKSEVVVSNVVNGLYGGTAKELEGYKSGNIQTGSKKSEKTSSATLLNVSHSGKSPVQGISKENVSNKGWSSSRRKVEGSTNFGAALPKGASSTASSISQVYAQPDITGLMLLVPTFMNTMGRKFVLPLLSADQPISPEKAHAYASNITNGFKEVLEQQAALKNGIGVHRFKIDFMKMQEEITGKIIGGKFNEISGILKSYAEKACPSREAGCSGRLSQKKFDKFMAEFNRRIDPAINQLMQKMLSKSEVSDVKEQQISLKPKSYLNGTSVQGHLTQDRDLKNQGKVLIP